VPDDGHEGGLSVRVVVDTQLCKGHGVCMEEAPEVFDVSRAGKLTVLQPTFDASLRSKVEEAVKYCPTGALSIEADPQPRSASVEDEGA
jgi:ferredoxin